MDIWNRVLDLWESEGRSLSRDDVVRILRDSYRSARISPIKGASSPPDLFDKEMASLYVVGKYGMGLDVQYPDLFNEIFSREVRYEQAIAALLTESPERAKEKVTILLGGRVDDNEIARMLRLKLTEVYFGFTREESLLELLRALVNAFPEKEKLTSKYARFYIALKVARAIASGEARDRLTKEAIKQATALKISWLKRAIPDDNYIATIASEVYGVPKRILKDVLQLNGKRRERRPKKAETSRGS